LNHDDTYGTTGHDVVLRCVAVALWFLNDE
jgi:hypothetical protein